MEGSDSSNWRPPARDRARDAFSARPSGDTPTALLGVPAAPIECRDATGATWQIDDPAAAQLLVDPRTLRFLAPFIGRERTVAAAARELSEPLNTMLYRVKRTTGLGLLHVARVEPRKGRAIKYYRACADAFFVPHEATTAETLEALLEQWERPWQQLVHRSMVRAALAVAPDWGLRIYRGADGALSISGAYRADENWNVLADAAPAVLESWSTELRLDDQDAKALQRELAALYERYQHKGGRQRYILGIALAPLRDDDPLPTG